MTNEVACTELTYLFRKHGYKTDTHSGYTELASTVFSKIKVEYVIDEHDPDISGDPMPYGLYVTLVISSKNTIVNLLTCELFDIKNGQMINYVYNSDYHFFYEELKRTLLHNGMPF